MSDLGLAWLAGPQPTGRSGRPLSVLRAVAGVEVLAAACIVTVAAVAASPACGQTSPLRVTAAGLLTVLMVVVVVPGVACALGTDTPLTAASPRVAAACRVAAGGGIVGLWALLSDGPGAWAVWLFGVVTGSDIVITAWSRGLAVAPVRSWTGFQRSTAHVGVVVTSVAMLAASERVGFRHLVEVYVSIQLVVGVTSLAVAAWQRLEARVTAEVSTATESAIGRHQRDLAHWLHDDVCTALALARARLTSGSAVPEDLAEQLAALDHCVRVRQLDEVMAARPVRLAEIVQPYVRMAVDRGVEVTEVPSWDPGSPELEGDDARLAKRALAVVVPNAIQAGARTLAVRIAADDAALTVEVDDDAGGFDLAAAPAGRALDSLVRELGEGGVTVERHGAGSRLRVTILPSWQRIDAP